MRRANGPNDLLILIPAFNESGAIGGVIKEVRGVMPDAPVLVVDDASSDGTYDLAIGPDVRDLAGNAMDQDADGINGEAADDVFHGSFTVALPALVVTGLVPAATPAVFGKSYGLSYTVRNDGTLTVPANWTDTVYLSTKTFFDVSAVPLASSSIVGPSRLQGPHHSAQKSTSTGWDALMTD